MGTENQVASPQQKLIETERTVLAVLLNDSYAILPVMGVLPEPEMFSTVTHQGIYGAILALTKENVVPNVHTVAARLTDVSLDQLLEIARHFNTKVSREVIYLAELVAQAAQWRMVDVSLTAAKELLAERPNDIEGAVLLAGEIIMGAVERRGERDARITEVNKRLDASIATATEGGLIGYTTGSDWLDDKTGGLSPSHVWVVAAPYKGRKTTFARNLLIESCRAGASVDWFALEGDQESTAAGLLAMLATERLHTWGAQEEMLLSETFVRRGNRTAMQQDALSDARRELDSWNLRIYDGRDGIHSADRILHKVKRDRLLFGLNVFVVDYLQLLGQGKLFDRMEANTHQLQALIQENGLTGILLTQLNESTIWVMDDDDANEHYSPGVKGGGDVPAAADYLLVTRYRSNDPNTLKVNLKLARHAQPGSCKYQINPQSGRILRELGGKEAQ